MTSVNSNVDNGNLRRSLLARCAIAAVSSAAAMVLAAVPASAETAASAAVDRTSVEIGTTDWPWVKPPLGDDGVPAALVGALVAAEG